MRNNFLKIFFLLLPFVVFSQQKNYELTSIEFVGNKGISSQQLKTAIYSKESPNWASQILYKVIKIGGAATYLDSILVISDVNAIKTLYLAKGFFKVRVHYRNELDEEKGTAKIIFIIDEGAPSILKSFKVSGLNFVTEEFKNYLIETVMQDTNRVYEESLVNSKNNFVLSYLRDHGYMFARAEVPDVIIDTVKNLVNVKLNFNIGKRYKISDLFVSRTGIGKESVDDELMKDIVGIHKGDIFSSYDLRRGQVRLLRTNLFTSVAISGIISDTLDNFVPLSISGDIGSMNEISPEIKSSNEENVFTLGAGLSYLRKNFLGSARKFTIGTSIFYDLSDARASIEQPFLFGQPITTKIEGYFTNQKRKEDYSAKLYGSRLSLEFELPENVYLNSLSTYFNLERAEYLYQQGYLVGLASTYYQNLGKSVSIADSLAANFVSDTLKTREFISTNAILGASFGANKTNDFLYPTSGYSLSFLIEDANSLAYIFSKLTGSSFNQPQSVKLMVTSTLYPNLFPTRMDAFGIKFKLGQIITYRGDKAEVPINQRFYAGGNNSVRGWGVRELVPQNQLRNLASSTQEDLEAILVKGAALGGFFIFDGSFETRHKFSNLVGSALFIDYGNTWNDIKEFRIDQIAVAAGFGFRYYNEFIPFRIDFGFKVYDPLDTRSMFKKKVWGELLQFQIGIGEAF